ncbi:MAG: MBL fold metallo-hydrolase [bacterium]|nr:MBL fold metallo-hydrolase [bacterium]
MKIKFWGVRGSIPVPGADTSRYGGNTACVEVSGEKGDCIILDAGSGLRVLGLDLMKRGGPLPPIHIFISHTHWDHIQGFPFFVPCYIPGTAINVRGPVHYIETKTIRDVFDIQMQYDFFPVSNQQLDADIQYETLDETSLAIGSVQVKTQFVNHPIRCLSYRLTENGRSVVYATDHEPYYNLFDTGKGSPAGESDDDLLFGDVDATVRGANNRFVDFVRGADLFIVDSQYTPGEYPSAKRNWGHSSWDYCLEWMKDAEVDRMVLTHHDPLRTDKQLSDILGMVRQSAREKGIDPKKIITAKEGMEVAV